MLPLSPAYFAFAAAAILLYWIAARWQSGRLAVLLLANTLFLARFAWFYPPLLLAAATADFLLGLRLQALPRTPINAVARRLLVTLSIFLNIGLLAATKLLPLGFTQLYQWILPLSVSFYCFQSLTYTIDLYRGTRDGTRSLLTHLTAATLFTVVVAGPINRVSDLIKQLQQPFQLTKTGGGRAFLLIASGLIKKLLVADFFSTNVVNRVFDTPTLYSGAEVLFGVYAYALQIYFDFSGYTDIAMGVSQLLGLQIPDNFNRPYWSSSIADFWRRWHITFSRWLTDYLYFSLPSSRKSRAFNYINPVIVMLLGGLWHGVGWTFLAWGALHGLALAAERAFAVWRGRSKPTPATRAISIVCTFHFVCLTWVFFRATDIGNAQAILQRITSNTWSVLNITPIMLAWFVLAIALQFIPTDVFPRAVALFGRTPFILQGATIAAVVLLIQALAGQASTSFVYSNF
jgi:alginate O-acetyltransferase complex protein AlgI